jgi:alanine-glyoxylate transaminase / serine-glyoxylate transaminase / serine-pyruvate transaminase
VIITGGLGETAGKIWRLGLMGEAARPAYYARFLETLERVIGVSGMLEVFEGACAIA